MKVKVEDREAFLNFVRTENAWSFLDVRALKAPVEAWLEGSATQPPSGLTVDYYTSCNINRSK